MKFKIIIISFISVFLFAVMEASVSFACTQEELIKKANEVSAAFQQAAMKDPSKAEAVMDKAQEMQTKLENLNDATELCKAYDEMLSTMK
ncbi:hypothetical protein ACLBWZ_17355 [Brucellaceae bacterium C25G]